MPVTVRQLAELLQGTILGDENLVVTNAATLSEAEPSQLAFLEHANQAQLLADSRASVFLVPPGVQPTDKTLIQVADPLAAFITALRLFRGNDTTERPIGIHPRAHVDPTASIGADAYIGPCARVGPGSVIGNRAVIHDGASIAANCRLGDDVTLFPNAVLYDNTILGNRVVIHANAVLGAHGFGYRLQQGKHVKGAQFGHVELGDDVEIGACTTIDRGTFHATRIGAGTKIDNLVQIGHNCQVGRHNLFVSQMGMAGSSKTGDYVVVAGQVGIVDHVNIGDRVIVGGQAAVINDIPAGQRLLGSPAIDEREQKRILMLLQKLPEMRRELRRILQHLGLDDKEDRKAG